jgi:hypothetical protein
MSDDKIAVKIYGMNSNQVMANIPEAVEERGIHRKTTHDVGGTNARSGV